MNKLTTKLATLLALLYLLSACSSTGLVVLNRVVKAEYPHSISKDLAYGKQPWHRLDVYPNKQVPTQAASPVVIFIYGGGWDSGSKDQYFFAANAFVKRGYTVVVPDYLKYPDGKFPSFVEDGARAFEWTKKNIANFSGDPDNIFIVGHSAGAHTGALLSTDPRYLADVGFKKSDIRGFAGMAGPYGFTPKEKKYLAIFAPESNYPKMKAVNFVDGTEPPMLLMHGMKDKIVGVFNKDALLDKLREANVANQNIEYKGVSHVGLLLKLHPWFDKKHRAADDIDAFFKPLVINS
ncbi:MAG: alpha/beta hydrolase, partial [Arenicella sp.]|nr:alpha/beta hydrolase [Arenicella sp.]